MSHESEKHDEPLRSLIEAVVNDEASQEQHQRLEQRLLDDEQARDAWLNYSNLHASLNGWFMASNAAETSEDDLVDLPPMMSREGLEKSRSRRSHMSWLGLFAAVSLLLLVGVTQLPWFHSLAAEGPTIVQMVGDIQIKSTDAEILAAADGQTVRLGETVVSRSDKDRVVLRYADGTEIVLLGVSALTVTDSPRGGKQLHLRNGLLRADVARQPAGAPLLIVTPQARVRVLGTRFELATDEQDGTRLDLESGRVELVRGDEKPVKVEPNSIAIVPITADPIRVSPRPAVVSSPLREIDFRGLKSVAFSEDGTSLICGTRWQALYWYEDDRLEVVPYSTRGRDGISLRQQANSQLAYFDHQERQLVVWDAASRRPQVVFEDIARLKKQFRSSPDRPTSWNPASQLAVVSPQSDWLAFQAGREFRIWRVENDRWPRFAQNYDGRFVGALAASPDGQTLAVALRRDRVDLVRLNTGEVATTWSLAHEVPFAMDFSADGKSLAVGQAGHVAVHDVATGALLADFEQPGLPFVQVALSADGRFVAASSLGDRVWMWDVTGGVELPLLDIGGSIGDLAFAPSGAQLAVLSRGGRLTVWDVIEGAPETRTSRAESK